MTIRILPAVIFFFICLINVQPISAHSETGHDYIAENVTRVEGIQKVINDREEKIQQNLEINSEKREQLKTTIQQRRETVQEKVQNTKGEFAANHADRLEKRFSLYNTRLSSLADKIEKRIEIRETEGKENGLAQLRVDEARKQLVIAVNLGAEAVKMFRAIEAAELSTQSNLALTAKEKAEAARKAFMETHRLLREAIQEMNEGKQVKEAATINKVKK